MYARWLPDAAHKDGVRSAGVTTQGELVTVEWYRPECGEKPNVFARADQPTTGGGETTIELTPDGARKLAAMLLEAARHAETGISVERCCPSPFDPACNCSVCRNLK